jgi:hypothetical protein
VKPQSWALALAVLIGASALGLSWAALPALSSGPISSTPAATVWPAAGEMSTAAISGCPMFPADNVWNTPVDSLPVDPNSDAYINSIGATRYLHPDFGADWNGGPFGIPYTTVPGTQPRVPITFGYAGESDPGPYPIPTAAPIEGGPSSGGDRHVLVVDRDNCVLYEMYNSWPHSNGSWNAGSGAVFTLTSNALRPLGWTSADAAGLPILPGLVRYDEVKAGAINHAIRFTAQNTRQEYVWPARHYASDNTSPSVPPMGQRFRLKATFPIASYAADVQVILKAFKTYGLILADNGSNWYISGAPDARWNDDVLNQLKGIAGSNFEAVDESSLMVNINSGQVATAPVADLRVTQAVTGSGQLTATLRWAPPASAMTTTVRYSTALITAGNWGSATVITDTLPGGTGVLTDDVSFLSDGIAYFALKFQTDSGAWSPLSNNAFWPRQAVYLPIILRSWGP